MLSNIPPPGHPDLTRCLRIDVFNELPERAETARLSDDPAVQANRHHLRCAGIPFSQQRVERTFQVLVELLRRECTGRTMELQIIVVIPGRSSEKRELRLGNQTYVYGTISIPSGFSLPSSAGTSDQ